jgi:hypothetical protein
MKINRAQAFEDGGVTLMDRVYGNAGTALTQATTTSIVLAVYQCNTEDDAENAVGTVLSGVGGSLTVSAVVYDSLQTAAPWTKDTTGYNFRYNAAATHLPVGGKWYRFEFLVTPTSGAAFWVVWIVEALPVAGS